ncbi:molecular chaperone DnaK [Paenibacillus darwinianus]|uniref:Molecular chaperone DnaK n=1 Tax=Paenibacillus darwinianus TaxID=1380763 RepID=A0A9W5S355_9BACL|nr:TraR/DksA C4-type zinc finger protein [Paenibacillus darwinianus]EXX91710.1 molecular chaperone DnaK [Paenibacillus darwinianus]EXX92574.1 molecular chaperone DnaK [Paenibacillus darwinianus]EXX92702.1 molecular chaperone DnaK [Paenibacillus darwinianus]
MFELTELTALRARLIEDRELLENRLRANDHYGMAESQRWYTNELSTNDNHPGDLGTETFEKGKDLSLLERDEWHLRRIGEALEAMDQGTYGLCRTCGHSIPLERLQALPDTLYCVQHSPRQMKPFDRPVEEELLNPPFGRTSMDEQDSYNGFDGEDAWQIVQSYGNSNSPALSENPSADYEESTIEAGEHEGFVEPIESFLATDITGRHVAVIRNSQYREYLASREGDRELEWTEVDQEADDSAGQSPNPSQ